MRMFVFALFCAFVMGCSSEPSGVASSDPALSPSSSEPSSSDPSSSDPSSNEPSSNEPSSNEESRDESVQSNTSDGAPAAAVGMKSVPIESGVATLRADNTTIQFVGTHAGDRGPDPRTGVFTEFSGTAKIDADSKVLRSVAVDIKTDSLTTAIGKLTGHLKSPDFFDVREYPTAKFESTNITLGEENGQYTIIGDLTLMGTTKELTFPAKVTIGDEGLTLRAELVIDRTAWGMDGQDGVNKEVSLSVAIGHKTQAPK